MDITLELARDVLRRAYGRDSYIASFITSITPDDTQPTACITADGAMRYNPAFVHGYVTGPDDLFCLVTHELLHPLLGHFVYDNGPLEGIATDMVINAILSLTMPKYSGSGSLFRKFYAREGLEGLLRPDSRMGCSRYCNLYLSFYGNHHGNLSTGEVIRTLKVLTPAGETQNVVLIGNHKTGKESGGEAFSKETLGRIAGDLRYCAAQPQGTDAGCGEAVRALLVQTLQSHQSLKQALLRRYTTKRKIDAFLSSLHRSRTSVSPLPVRPSKRECVLLAAGVPLLHYRNERPETLSEKRGLAVYLDVSGSVNAYLPKIIGVLRHLQKELHSIFLFSNTVVEVPFKTLLAGHVQTTYGTDFDCVAKSILDNDLDKAVILTDGFATMTDEHQRALKERGVKTLTILFGGTGICPEFEALGGVIQLDEAAA